MWNLDSIHKIGELVAAVAVVISLLFAGLEVQQTIKFRNNRQPEA